MTIEGKMTKTISRQALVAFIALLLSAGIHAIEMPVGQALSMKVSSISSDGKLEVTFENASSAPQRLFQTSNSWGWRKLKILLLRDGETMSLTQIPQAFTRNVPKFDVLPPGQTLVRKIELNDGSWLIKGSRIDFRARDVILVVYEIPETEESQKYKVWEGILSATVAVPGSRKEEALKPGAFLGGA